MAHANRVVQSIETDDGTRCVDVFVRADGTFGFEEYRRDVEDGCGWFPIGFHATGLYASAQSAMEDALSKVAWLHTSMGHKF
jgi:hypothetical protein